VVIIIIEITSRPEKRKELSLTLHSIVVQLREESGCEHAAVYQDLENENDFILVEKWTTKNDSDDHQRSDIFKVLQGTRSLLLKPPEIMIRTSDFPAELEV